MSAKLQSLFKSRRFWVAVLGVVAIVARDLLKIDEQQVLTIGGIIVAWIIGDTLRVTE